MGKHCKKFNSTGGLESFNALMLFLLAAGKFSRRQLLKEFEDFDNKISAGYIAKIIDAFNCSSIRYLIEESREHFIKSNGIPIGVKKLSLRQDVKDIEMKDLLSLVDNNNMSAYDIFIRKYPSLIQHFNTVTMVDDYDRKNEENIPPKESLCAIIIYLLYYKGQMKISDMVYHIENLYGESLYCDKDIMKCFRDMKRKQIINLVSKLDIENEGVYTYFLKKQVFADKVKYEELKELCYKLDINDFDMGYFLDKYKNLRIYFNRRKKISMIKFSDLSKNHLIESIFFILLTTTNSPMTSEEIFDRICDIDKKLSDKYDIGDIDNIFFTEFPKHPIQHIIIEGTIDDINDVRYAIKQEVIDNKITIDDLFDLYLTDRCAIENFCQKYPELRNLFPSYDKDKISKSYENEQDMDEDDIVEDEQDMDEDDIEDGRKEKKRKKGKIDVEFDGSCNLSDLLKKIMKNISKENITININVSGDMIINN